MVGAAKENDLRPISDQISGTMRRFLLENLKRWCHVMTRRHHANAYTIIVWNKISTEINLCHYFRTSTRGYRRREFFDVMTLCHDSRHDVTS